MLTCGLPVLGVSGSDTTDIPSESGSVSEPASDSGSLAVDGSASCAGSAPKRSLIQTLRCRIMT